MGDATPGGSSERISLYCGYINTVPTNKICGVQEEGEDIYVKVLKVKTAFQAMANGKIKNSHTIIALQWLQLNLAILKKKWIK